MDQDQKQGDKGLFPYLLHDLLDDVEKSNESDIIAWAPSGRCFRVFKKESFTAHVLPRYFKQSKYKSFVRQLNIWGFSCINKGPNKGHYFHSNFIRGRKDFCSGMVREKIKGTGPLRGQQLVKNQTSQPVGCSRRSFEGMPAHAVFTSLHTSSFSDHQFQSPTSMSGFSSSTSSTLVGAGPRGFSSMSGVGSTSSLCGDQSAYATTVQSSLSFSPPELVMEHPQVSADTRVVSDSKESTMAHQTVPPFGAANVLVSDNCHQHDNEVYVQNEQAAELHGSSWKDHPGASAHQSNEQDCRYSILRSLQEQLHMLCKERDTLLMPIGASGDHITDASDNGTDEDWFSSLEKDFDETCPHRLPSSISIDPSVADSPMRASSYGGSTAGYQLTGNNNHVLASGDLFEPTPLDWRGSGSVVMQL